jgi:hypothetical protein
VFGRRKREEAAAAEAAREAERRALFTKLAQRPEHICPFLGLAADRTGYVDGISDEHRCFAFGDPAPLSAEQQTRVCQERGYGNCPRYLRGVLVIPTEELEALRRPRAPIEQPPPPPPVERRRRGVPPVVGIVGIVLLVGIGAAAAIALFGGQFGIGAGSPTPLPSPTAIVEPSPSASVAPSETGAASPTATPSPTPVVLPSGPEWPPALPTPAADAVETGWIVAVQAGELPVVRINEDGTVGEQANTIFSRRSGAPVDRLEIDGEVYWMTLAGVYTRLAYVDGLSGGPDEFVIFESYENPDGSPGFVLVPEDER